MDQTWLRSSSGEKKKKKAAAAIQVKQNHRVEGFSKFSLRHQHNMVAKSKLNVRPYEQRYSVWNKGED